MCKFRKLKATEIECRIAQATAKGVSLLLYKDARVDQNILDETVGPMYWQRSHQLIGDRLYCTVEIYDKQMDAWVAKQDVGTESYTEKEKGQASDSFKRACFNWGIGRELYTAPFIWVGTNSCEITEKNGKHTCYDRFDVAEIEYDGDVISYLKIVNVSKKNMTVYTYGKPHTAEAETPAVVPPAAEKPQPKKAAKAAAEPKPEKDIVIESPTAEDVANLVQQVSNQLSEPKMITDAQIANINTLMKARGVFSGEIYKMYNIKSAREMTYEQANDCIIRLNNTKR